MKSVIGPEWHVASIDGIQETALFEAESQENSKEIRIRRLSLILIRPLKSGTIEHTILPWIGYAIGAVAPGGDCWGALPREKVRFMFPADTKIVDQALKMWSMVGAKGSGLSIVEGGREV